ncbi:MAG: FAD-dependent thymidylate synthase, partial [Dehalococcoidia bacterium]|nr:FAD-dependent thymidylate synthase [Dehalococcoidia bacterium]
MDRGHEIKVLDHGYVRLVDSMGTDESIVEAARISTGRGFESWKPYQRCKGCADVFPLAERAVVRCGCGEGFEHFPRGDLGILDYLYRNRHTTPFEMCELIIDVKVP